MSDLTCLLAQCARDIDNLREGEARSAAPFSEKVLFTDGLAARWTGREHLRTHAPVGAVLKSARAVVNSMSMDGLDAAFIGWSLNGQTPAGPVSLVRLCLQSATSVRAARQLSACFSRDRCARRGLS